MLIFLTFLQLFAVTNQLIYPIASSDKNDKSQLYTVYQKGFQERELWAIDLENQEAFKTILSSFLPTAVTLLPSRSGFSFIDRGRLRVKYFHKRSPRSVIFEDPLHDFTCVEWVNDKICFFSARRYNRHVIMLCNIDDRHLHVIEEDTIGDCLYPQKANNKLFCILQAGNYYSIIKNDFLNPLSEDENSVILLNEDDDAREIVNFQNRPIAFLKMLSEQSGYVVELLKRPENSHDTFKFAYHSFNKTNNSWFVEKLFDFAIRQDIILADSNHLNEALHPFMPQHCNTKIFYTSLGDDGTMNIFEYCLTDRKSTQKTFKHNNEHVFAPYPFKNKIFYGKRLSAQEKAWVDEDGDISRLLPHILRERVFCENN